MQDGAAIRSMELQEKKQKKLKYTESLTLQVKVSVNSRLKAI